MDGKGQRIKMTNIDTEDNYEKLGHRPNTMNPELELKDKPEKQSSLKLTPEFIWEQCLELAGNEELVPKAFILSSLDSAEVSIDENSQLIVSVFHHFDRIHQEFIEPLSACLQKVCTSLEVEQLDLQVLESSKQPNLPYEAAPLSPTLPLAKANILDPKFTFENFVQGKESELAFGACQNCAESPGENYNPLFLYGDVGLGKTHLLHSIANYVVEHFPTYAVEYVTADQFVKDYVTATRNNDFETFDKKYMNADVLLLDDVQFLSGKEATKDQLFNIFNHLQLAGKQIVLVADRRPSELEDLPERLTTRFSAGLVIDIHPPELETRIAILECKATSFFGKFQISTETFQFIAENFTNNIRLMEGALTRLLAQARADDEQTYINLSYARTALAPLLGNNVPLEATPGRVLELCADFLHVTIEKLTGPKRNKEITLARHISMYAIRETSGLSFPQIGAMFGGRDHSSVMHANKRVEKLMSEDPAILAQVNELIRKIKQDLGKKKAPRTGTNG